MQLTVGICAAKALVQYLCGRFNDPDNVHIFILRSRDFDAYVPTVFLSKCTFGGISKMQWYAFYP